MEFSDCKTAEAVIKKYSSTVYKLAYANVRSKSDADDIFQEVFLRYIRNTPKFDSEEHRKAWLIRVTINCSKSHLSSPWRKKVVPLCDDFTFTSPEETGLDEALKKLPQKYRSVIHLFYYEGYSTEEIGSILGLKSSTVRAQLTRARNKLSVLLKGEL